MHFSHVNSSQHTHLKTYHKMVDWFLFKLYFFVHLRFKSGPASAQTSVNCEHCFYL